MSGMLFVVSVPTADHEREQIRRNTEDASTHALGETPSNGSNPAGPKTFTESHPLLERALTKLLKDLKIDQAVWCSEKNNKFYQVFFPLESGEPTENCLHSLSQLKIGSTHNSSVSVVPCSVFLQGLEEQEEDVSPADRKAWDNFVESVRAKLTVKQVVDGVRSGAEVTFDYVTLILTADFVAAVVLIENNTINITAAMLISPLMGAVVALAFGTSISDRSLQWVGVKGIFWGGFISLIFGLIFGLLVGSASSPWGNGSWPTPEMLERGHYRSLWMGVLWALPSGSGVALALMQGMNGPLIGVAISATFVPPVVNCGLMWGLAATKSIYGDKMKIPHVAGEPYDMPSMLYRPIYSHDIQVELAIMGIVSFCLTLVNMVCIYTMAMVILKIKEVAAPYTSSPDLRRFWEHDVPLMRDSNRQSMRQSRQSKRMRSYMGVQMQHEPIPEEDVETLELAVQEAVNHNVFRRVNRCSYGHTASDLGGSASSSRPGSGHSGVDPALLEQLLNSLKNQQAETLNEGSEKPAQLAQHASPGLSRFRQVTRSMRRGSLRSRTSSVVRRTGSSRRSGASDIGGNRLTGVPGGVDALPTILERGQQSPAAINAPDNAELEGYAPHKRVSASSSVRAMMQAMGDLGALGGRASRTEASRSRRGSETINLM